MIIPFSSFHPNFSHFLPFIRMIFIFYLPHSTLRKERARSLIQTWPEYPKPPYLQTEQSYPACGKRRGPGFPPANMNMSLGYFHRKIEEKRIESKEIPSCLIPCLLVLFCSDSVWYQKKFFPLFVTLVFSQIWKGRILSSSQQILMLSKNNFRQSMLYNGTMWARSDK